MVAIAMSAVTSLDFTYRYGFPSGLDTLGSGAALRLATCGAQQEQPHFFEGRLRHPREIGDLLLVLTEVVRTHFFLPRPANLDPVVTSSEGMLRFEGFSGCCGVYARVDLLPRAFSVDLQGRGTTNVDFNNPMRAALTRLRDTDDMRLAVGRDEVELSSQSESIVEKKVKLPIRWIKGMSEVQLYQPLMSLKLESAGAEARQLIRSLRGTAAAKRPSFVTRVGRSLRVSQREQPGSVRFMGTHRVRVLEPLMKNAKSLRIWADDTSGTSAWEVQLESGRLFLMLSPEVYRGFSGEGQALTRLATGCWEEALPHVQAQLAWQAEIDADTLAQRTKQQPDAINAALAVLGARGMAGYDLAAGRYFHRELPFDLGQVEKLQPRLIAARKLVEAQGVKPARSGSSESMDFAVKGTGVEHIVRLRPEGDKCSCPWFSKHQGERGPCKHILAARIVLENDSEESKQ